MFNIYLAIDIIVVIALLVLGMAVLLKNMANSLNRDFSLFTGCISVWIIANFISNDTKLSPEVARIADYPVFLFSFISAVYLLKFAAALAEDKQMASFLRRGSPIIILVGIISCTPFLVKGVEVQGSVYAVNFGPLLPLYFVALLSSLLLVFIVLIRAKRQAYGVNKARLSSLLRSISTALPLLLLANFIIPTLTGWFGLTNLGVLTMVIVVYGLYYSVVKHKMFNLRLIIVRSLIYVFALGLLATAYAFLSDYLTTIISKNHNLQSFSYIPNTLLIIAVMLLYDPSKRKLSKVTNRYFYKEGYDTQQLFDEINHALISTIDLNRMLNNTSMIVAESLKAEFCCFTVKDPDSKRYRIIGTENRSFRVIDIQTVRRIAHGIHSRVIIVENLEEDASGLKALLAGNGVAVLVVLSSKADRIEEGVGYMVLGDKRSGSPYTTQDARVLDSLAAEFILAIENTMRFEEIKEFNSTLELKINEATRKLRRANEKLKNLDETKDDFISMASHQLRTPLTSIKGYLSMLMEGDAGELNDVQKQMISQSFISSQRMVFLISDMLNVSRLKTGKFAIDPLPVNLADIVQQEIEQLKETAASRSLELTFEKPEDFPVLMLDETKIRQVIMNFTDNAIYYTPSGGHIRVVLENNPHSIDLKVIDDGIGVPNSEKPHLFTKFYRAQNARVARPDGTGLGLFMAQKVIVGQGGAIIFESHEGKGSTFGFTFPKARIKVTDNNPAPQKVAAS